MKKYGMLLLFFAACCAGAADLVPGNGSFENWKGESPEGFAVNTVFKNWQVCKRNGGVYDGETCLHVVTRGGTSAFALMAGFVPAGCGDKVSLSCAVRGKGKMRFEIYCYDARGRWVGKNVQSRLFDVDTDQWLVEKFDGVLPSAVGLKNGPVAKVRAVLFVSAGSALDLDMFSGTAGTTASVEMKKPVPVPAAAVHKPVAAIEPRAPIGAVYLPPRLYAVPGQELNIYFDNLYVMPPAGSVEVCAGVGVHLQDRFQFIPKPEETGTHPVRLEWRDAAGNLTASAETEIVVAPAAVAPRSVKVLMIGDSLTNATIYPRHIAGALRADKFEVSFVGSHAGNGKPAAEDGVVHEGYGGWQFSHFVNRWTPGDAFRAKSPFLAGPGKLDIPGFFAKKGGVPDVITVLLGVNDIAACTRETLPAKLESISRDADTLLNALAEAAPKAKIGVGLIPPPAASQDAFGFNYTTRINRVQYLRNTFALWQMMEKKYRNHPRFELVPVNVNIDCRNNYPVRKTPYNAQNPETYMMQNNAVHPAASGYRQIGDSFYFWMRSFLR